MTEQENKKVEYQVLARKYRPQGFEDLIGQDALVRTLKNAIDTGRIAHAFMLTGIRGVGKTTTARIIAKALNYTGKDGKSGPTTGNTDDCDVCRAIAEGNHPDVIEMDAASHTGVDDIRDLIDGVRYAPASARYKIYIIDEVHMLSKNAFNALLKTLEEPPAHVKFIFATTEIRKIPVTVLSRCQRFDLRRIEFDVLKQHYKKICQKEGASFDEAAIDMITRAADGSVRDGLSMLDQAIALGNGEVNSTVVSTMLGLSDTTKMLDIFEAIMGGKTEVSLALFGEVYANGVDPAQAIEALLELTHMMTKAKVLKDKANMAELAAGDIERGRDMATKLSMSSLNRAWQILTKGLIEVKTATHPFKAAEMVLIRLIYAADMPDPSDLLKKIESGAIANTAMSQQTAPTSNGNGAQLKMVAQGNGGGVSAYAQSQPSVQPDQQEAVAFSSLEELHSYLKPREVLLAGEIYEYAHPVKFKTGHIELAVSEGIREGFFNRLSKALKQHSGQSFMVVPSEDREQPTLAVLAAQALADSLASAAEQTDIKKVLSLFSGSKITEILYD
jgi:DNA polymerase-3 subunit gamma/tau